MSFPKPGDFRDSEQKKSWQVTLLWCSLQIRWTRTKNSLIYKGVPMVLSTDDEGRPSNPSMQRTMVRQGFRINLTLCGEFGTMADTYIPLDSLKCPAPPHITALFNIECIVWCFFPSQGVERALQPQPWPAGVDSQQWQPPHPLQHGVHLLGAFRTLGGRRGAQRGRGQPPGGQVRATGAT